MRLKSVFIGDYKNLKNFSLEFDGDGFVDIFVGKNGSGKSNFLEALIEIFNHIYSFDADDPGPGFEYAIAYVIEEKITTLEWKGEQLIFDGKTRRTTSGVPVPDNILVYYSGQNSTVTLLTKRYEDAFRSRIKGAEFDESPKVISIGPANKELLLSVLLMQPEACKARKYVCQKLCIKSVGDEIKLTLKRPIYAQGTNQAKYDIDDVDGDRFWKPEGITKEFLDCLALCQNARPNGVVRDEGYFREPERYVIYLDVAKIRAEFSHLTSGELFRQFDNLKTLGMLGDISLPFTLENDAAAEIGYFSDGQFQSVYIFAVTELFKGLQCMTLLDEPDAFLHPEWQFDFLKQVLEISTEAAATNHVLMSSHSASTIASKVESRIRLFEIVGNRVEAKEGEKADLIKSLSAGLITFSETEARLNISHFLKSTTKPVLFTEGISDEVILETAWAKIHPNLDRPFEIENAFDCSFLRNLVKRQSLYADNPGRIFFALFDFDEAYNDWVQLGDNIEIDPGKCLTRKPVNRDCYAMLLPVPQNLSIKDQVIRPETGADYGARSKLTIELLFHDVPNLEGYFEPDPAERDGCIRFGGDKVSFANEVVKELDAEHFEVFRPVFDFIQSKIPN